MTRESARFKELAIDICLLKLKPLQHLRKQISLRASGHLKTRLKVVHATSSILLHVCRKENVPTRLLVNQSLEQRIVVSLQDHFTDLGLKLDCFGVDLVANSICQ